MSPDDTSIYDGRRLSEGYPGLETLSLDYYDAEVAARPDDEPRMALILGYLDRLIDLGTTRSVLVVGCGPRPEPMRILRAKGFDVVGVEPVPAFVEAAHRYLGDDDAVCVGRAEQLPHADESQDVVVLESVLEHVDSVRKSLSEVYRVLAPGGVAYVETTNRHRLAVMDAEFNVRFYPLLPAAVKESYVFRQLHFDPSLANYAGTPAVHWFTYPDLCKAGREAGFSRFYSHLDLKDPVPASFSSESGRTRRLKASILPLVQRNPWLRALALSQLGGMIFMVKRR
jgi:SAM-dependent methyltransferase